MTSLPMSLRVAIEGWAQTLATTSQLSRLARSGKITPRALALYLESLRYLFVHSQRNLVLAAERSEALGLTHIAPYFARKASEEKGHDRWAIDDLQRLPEASLTDLTAAPSIVKLVELQRSLIAEHPLCFVVYALWAEYFTVLIGDEWIDALTTCGYDRSQLSAIGKHIDADREHAAVGFDVLEHLWNGEPEADALLCVVERASRVFEQFCDEVCQAAVCAA